MLNRHENKFLSRVLTNCRNEYTIIIEKGKTVTVMPTEQFTFYSNRPEQRAVAELFISIGGGNSTSHFLCCKYFSVKAPKTFRRVRRPSACGGTGKKL